MSTFASTAGTPPFSQSKPVSDLTMVEVAEQLEQVTSWIEVQRVQERDARKQYQEVADRVEHSIAQIRAYAKQLVEYQRRKMNSFDGLLGSRSAESQSQPLPKANTFKSGVPGGQPKNLGEAIVALWTSRSFSEPLTTEEIADGLPEVGYESNAAPTSLKSSVNQALAKLCRSGVVVRLRADGSRISPRDTKSRARKYIAASLAQDEAA